VNSLTVVLYLPDETVGAPAYTSSRSIISPEIELGLREYLTDQLPCTA
jgi:hypothetical protein